MTTKTKINVYFFLLFYFIKDFGAILPFRIEFSLFTIYKKEGCSDFFCPTKRNLFSVRFLN